MTIRLNKSALAHAKSLVSRGEVVADGRDDWSEAAPTAAEENAFIDEHGYAEYGKWHLGIDEEQSRGTKGRYSFPYGDFRTVRRGGVIALESRAAQNDHTEIATAAKELLERIDAD